MTFIGKLRPYQEEAAEAMIRDRFVLVAYDMGTGKTVITIAVIEHLLEQELVKGGLIIVPANLKHQWVRQIEAFSDCAKPVMIAGNPKQREKQYKAAVGRAEYVIVNYEQVVNDWRFITKLDWDFIVLDEAQAIKSMTAKRSKKIKKLTADYWFALTGQPLENRPEDVYSIMQAVDPAVLGDHDVFDQTFIKRDRHGNFKGVKNLPLLHKVLSGSMIRKSRNDPDVASQMPKVQEENIFIDFDPAGAKLYSKIAEHLLNAITEAFRYGTFNVDAHYGYGEDQSSAQGQVMSRLLALRMLCMHPDTLRLSAQRFAESHVLVGDQWEAEGVGHGSQYLHELMEGGYLPELGAPAPKFNEAVSLVREIWSENDRNKVVLFSFSKDVLAMLAETFGDSCVQFTGDMSVNAKDKAKVRFQTDPRCRLFLSSDAGGYGVDLPQANYLINYDLPWSAGKADQRNARIIRLSSEFDNVTVINLLMWGSIEERLYDVLAAKRKVAAAVVDGVGFDTVHGDLSIDMRSLTEFLEETDV